MSQGPSSPTAELADQLHSRALRLLRYLRKADKEGTLSSARLSALSVLVYAGPMQLRALAEVEEVRSPTMTGLVQALVEEGLVKKSADPDDRRAVVLSATRKGKSALQRARQRRLDLLETALASLSKGQLKTLLQATEILKGLEDNYL